MMNQLASTPTRIPKASNSLIDLPRRNMLQWWHSGPHIPPYFGVDKE